MMLTGPMLATLKVLDRTGFSTSDIDLFEINEAFASVVAAWRSEIPGDPAELWARTNVNGGAIALGHPLGCSGTKLLTTLVHELQRSGSRYGLQAMCEGSSGTSAPETSTHSRLCSPTPSLPSPASGISLEP